MVFFVVISCNCGSGRGCEIVSLLSAIPLIGWFLFSEFLLSSYVVVLLPIALSGVMSFCGIARFCTVQYIHKM
jgi:hypothetical protein